MKARSLVAVVCVLSAPSACGGMRLTLAEGETDAAGGFGGATTIAPTATTGSGGSTTTEGAAGSIPEAGPGGAGGMGEGLVLDLIDDMEDGDELLPVPARSGRTGRWNTYNDGSPEGFQWPGAMTFFTMSPLPSPRGTSTKAARTYGHGFHAEPSGGWATLEVSFLGNVGNPDAGNLDGGLPPGVYDASAYKGIVFWAKIGDQPPAGIRVNVTSLQTLPQGGICQICYDSFGYTKSFTTEWAQYVLPFEGMTQRHIGDPVDSLDLKHVFTVTFGFGGPTPFDLWVDDIAFYK
jgi:hypothetical protein